MSLQKIVTVIKFQFQRGYTYFGALGMGFVVASTLQNHQPFIGVPLWILFPIAVLLTWAVGAIDMMYGFYAAEAVYQTRENPMFREIHESTRKR